MTTAERFGEKKVTLVSGHDTELVSELLTVLAEYTMYYEPRYLGDTFIELLRLIRANPVQVVAGEAEYRSLREAEHGQAGLNIWIPTSGVGLKVMVGKRHPLYRLVSHHFPPQHRVWRYIGERPRRHYGD